MKTIRLLIAMTCIMISLYAFLSLGLKGIKRDPDSKTLSEGWTVSVNGAATKDVNINEYKLRNTVKGDIIELTNTLPYCGISSAVAIMDSHLSEIDVYVGNELIYVSGKKQFDAGKLVGYGRHQVELPLGYEGKEIRIVYKTGDNNAINALVAPIIMPAASATGYLLRRDFLPAAIAIGDMIVGLAMAGMALVFIFSDVRFKHILYIGLFSFVGGLWSFCDHDSILLINADYQMKTVSEYISLYLAPIFLFAFYGTKVQKQNSGIWLTVYKFLLYGDMLLVGVSVFLHVTNILHLTRLLQMHHLMMLIMIGYMGSSFVNAIIRKEKVSAPFYIGIAFLSLCGTTDIIYYNLLVYSKRVVGVFDGISYMGSAILVIAMFIDFAEDILDQAHQASEMEVYEKMANSDFLTGLANRRQCELVFDEIDQDDSDYAIIAFDLNNLKPVNDKYGHAAGDRLLKDFASILKSVFDSVATIGRTGGDEFVVIIRHAEVLNLNQLLGRLDQKTSELNSKRKEYKVSAARGLCTRRENKRNVRSAYRIADQRMYENKIQMKADVKGKQS